MFCDHDRLIVRNDKNRMNKIRSKSNTDFSDNFLSLIIMIVKIKIMSEIIDLIKREIIE